MKILSHIIYTVCNDFSTILQAAVSVCNYSPTVAAQRRIQQLKKKEDKNLGQMASVKVMFD